MKGKLKGLHQHFRQKGCEVFGFLWKTWYSSSPACQAPDVRGAGAQGSILVCHTVELKRAYHATSKERML